MYVYIHYEVKYIRESCDNCIYKFFEKYKKERERTNVDISKNKNVYFLNIYIYIYLCMTFRKLLHDLKAGFQ